MEFTDLRGFAAFLAERDLVPERQLPYFVSWVRRYLHTPMRGRRLSDKDKRMCSLLSGSQWTRAAG